MVASSAEDDLPEERRSNQYRGKTALQWSPYAPGEHEETVARVAVRREKRRLLAAVDERSPDATTALEPRSREDTESVEQTVTLDELLDHTLPLMCGQHSEYDRWALPDAESFTSSLRKVLIRLQNEALKSVEVVRSPATPADGLHTFPLLGRIPHDVRLG
ncbi:FxsC protein [Streptomyces sp. NPDC048179]|uniref:FxsC protein n=1 Tax=Streptomyces sp. NPDC048179 TaxID=3365506 RepID=UPI00371B64E6